MACSLWAGAAGVQAAPGILITNLPAYASTVNLAGLVYGVNSSTCSVAVFTYSSAAGWWSKPYCSTPLTAIQPNGEWQTDISIAGNDINATRIAALLVPSSYSLPCVQGSNNIPTNVWAEALAAAVVTRPSPGVRWLNFSGYDWWVRNTVGLSGPGPNNFSNSTNNVWLDELGQVHLRVTNRSNKWQCAEIYSARSFGYGTYRFRVNTATDKLDPVVVLGLFTYSDDAAYNYREIDVECTRWSVTNDVTNAQFVVQPSAPSRKVRFTVPANQTNVTYQFTWEPGKVTFQSQRGAWSPTPYPTNVISSWTYTSATFVPKPGDETVRFNLWLDNGDPPLDGKEAEVVIQSFEFIPLAPAPAPALLDPRRGVSGQFRFSFASQPDRRYQVQGSPDLLSWQELTTILATNLLIHYTETNVAEPVRHFRAAALP